MLRFGLVSGRIFLTRNALYFHSKSLFSVVRVRP